jgi:uncharacterized protein YciW
MTTSDPGTAPDIIDQLAGLSPATQQLRGLRPAEPGALSQAERELIGLRVGLLSRAAPVAAEHRKNLLAIDPELAAAAERFPAGPALPARAAAILRFTDRLTNEPVAATRADIQALEAAGLSAPEIVTLAQLIAYLSFQVRLVAGLRALQEETR